MVDFYVIYNPRSKARECYVGQSFDYQRRFKEHVKGRSGGKTAQRWMAAQSELRVRRIARLPVSAEHTRSAATAVERGIYERLRSRGWSLPQIKPCGTLSADFAREVAALTWEYAGPEERAARREKSAELGRAQWAGLDKAARTEKAKRHAANRDPVTWREQARQSAIARWARTPVEDRRAHMAAAGRALSTEERREIGRRTQSKYSAAERSERMTRAHHSVPAERRSAIARLSAAALWDGKSDAARREWSARMTAARWGKQRKEV